MEAEKDPVVLLVSTGRHSIWQGDGLLAVVFTIPYKESIVSPIVLVLVVILILSLLGGGYGFQSGNAVLGAGGGALGLILLILVCLALLGRLQI